MYKYIRYVCIYQSMEIDQMMMAELFRKINMMQMEVKCSGELHYQGKNQQPAELLLSLNQFFPVAHWKTLNLFSTSVQFYNTTKIGQLRVKSCWRKGCLKLVNEARNSKIFSEYMTLLKRGSFLTDYMSMIRSDLISVLAMGQPSLSQEDVVTELTERAGITNCYLC